MIKSRFLVVSSVIPLVSRSILVKNVPLRRDTKSIRLTGITPETIGINWTILGNPRTGFLVRGSRKSSKSQILVPIPFPFLNDDHSVKTSVLKQNTLSLQTVVCQLVYIFAVSRRILVVCCKDKS